MTVLIGNHNRRKCLAKVNVVSSPRKLCVFVLVLFRLSSWAIMSPSLIRVFAVRSMGSQGPKLSSCGQRRLWSDWADAQADLSLRWGHTHFVGVVMSWLIFFFFFFLRVELWEVRFRGCLNLRYSPLCIRQRRIPALLEGQWLLRFLTAFSKLYF